MEIFEENKVFSKWVYLYGFARTLSSQSTELLSNRTPFLGLPWGYALYGFIALNNIILPIQHFQEMTSMGTEVTTRAPGLSSGKPLRERQSSDCTVTMSSSNRHSWTNGAINADLDDPSRLNVPRQGKSPPLHRRLMILKSTLTMV